MFYLRILQVAVIVAISTFSSCHVLLAGDEDTFRSFAKKYVPKYFAEKVTNVVAETTGSALPEMGDYEGNENPTEEFLGSRVMQDYEQDRYDYQDQADNRKDMLEAPDSQAGPQPRRVKEPKQMKVNLDELVEKVREKLLLDMTTTTPEIFYSRDVNYEDDPSVKFDESHAFVSPKKYENTILPSRPKQRLKIKQTTKSDVMESHDLYEKVKISKKGNKMDSYEDYIKALPKPDDSSAAEEDIHDEKDNEKSQTKERDENFKEIDEIRATVQSKAVKQINEKNDNDFNNNNEYSNQNILHRKSTKKQRILPLHTQSDVTYKNVNLNENNGLKRIKTHQSQGNNDNNKMDVSRNKKRRPKKRRPVRPEYVDDDYFTIAVTDAYVPKAATEYIGIDYKDVPPGRASTPQDEESSKYLRKKVIKRIVTNMAIRQRYTIVTPNYYEKLPRIAEKYNFDEPIPVKDQEEENLKPIKQQQAAINGIVKV